MRFMQSGPLTFDQRRCGCLAAWLCLALTASTAWSENHPPAKPAGSPPAASTAPAEQPIPQSVFIVPPSPKEGKDPFYPKSLRVYGTMVSKAAQPAAATGDLRLNGFSGPPDRRLAIINNRTFETSEEAEVNTNTGRVRIRCLEIKAESVIVQFVVGGERRELRLRQGV
jgi:hypothetical protein